MFVKARKTQSSHYMRFLPVKKNTVFYHAYRNRIMSCNPYAIFLELIKDPDFENFQHYWVYDSEDVLQYDTFKRYASLPNVHYIKASTPRYLRVIATSEFIINNAAMPDYWQKKKGQIYINTWHGTPLKMLGRHAKDFKESSIRNARRNFLIADYLVMPNRYTIEKILDSYNIAGLTQGTILDAGYPRNDLPLTTDSHRIRTLLEAKLGMSLEDKKIVLYAPTFRSENGISLDTSDVAIHHIQKMLELMPENYVLFFKIHNTLGKYFRNNKSTLKRLLFDEIETNELLSATDVLITDYSSIFFDFLPTKRPCLFFVYDRKEYESTRGLYLDVDSLPGALCYDVSDIIRNLDLIQSEKYDCKQKEARYLEQFAYNDDGQASKRVVDQVFRGLHLDEKYIFQDNSETQNILLNLGDSFNRKKCEMLRYFLKTNDMKGYRIFIDGNNLPDFNIFDDLAKFSFQMMGETTFLNSNIHFRFRQLINFDIDDESFLEKSRLYPNARISAMCMYADAAEKPKDIVADYDEVTFVCDGQIDSKHLNQNGVQFISSDDFCKTAQSTITYLFIAAADSMNYAYLECIKEIHMRGHNAIVVIQNENDDINNKPFNLNQIKTIPVRRFELDSIKLVDIVFTPPVKLKAYKRIYDSIKSKNIFTVAFSNLFSSVTMRVYPDVLFAIGKNKYDELTANHLRYNTIFVGNPQYDSLVRVRKSGSTADVKKVLIIDQGGYPYGDKGKKQFADFIINIAANNHEIQFDLKPRYGKDEKGTPHHSVYEQLVDYLEDMPVNLTILKNNGILEDMIVGYDAMIATWSTSYMVAAMINIPILLVEGFDSLDVFDVRTQRVEDAYTHLKKTGCLFHYQDLMDKPVKFSYIDSTFLDSEIYHNKELSTPKVIDCLEYCFTHFIKDNQRLTSEIVCGVDEFIDKCPTLATQDQDEAYTQAYRFRYKLNDLMQEAVYMNRCMGNVLNLGPLDIFYDREYENEFINKYESETMQQLTHAFVDILSDIKKQYFTDKANISRIENDNILQDYYLEWLYVTGNHKEIFHPSMSISAQSSLEYYRALSLLKHSKKKAYYHLNNYLRLLTIDSRPKQLLKEKRVSSYSLPFRQGKNKIYFYYFLLKYNNMNCISLFPENVTRKNPVLTFMTMLGNNRAGNYSISIDAYQEYQNYLEEQGTLQRKNKKKKSNIAKLFLRKIVNVFVGLEYGYAKRHIV